MKIRLLFGFLVFSLIFSFFLFPAWGAGEKEAKELEVVYLDVGQGDSTLINTPGGKHILIDGGIGAGSFGSEDQGKKIILPYLRSHGINRLDTVLGSHPDYDHIGGLASAVRAKNLTVGEFLDPGVAHPSRGYLDLLNAVKDRPEIKYRQPRAGDILNWGEEVEVEVISPPYLLKDNNESSIVIKLTYGDVSFLFTGDAYGSAEQLMQSRYGWRLRSTILKAGHHGSKHSSSEDFLRKVRPEVAIFSCGKDNNYGHPHPETIERLERVGAKMYRTDQQGTITITTDGKEYQVKTEK
ncbi:MAG: ComEC/Rec2 family competence protein [Candidatus Auribacterota bacterium]|nr:ComEC/Rec2 family competence protein [Candidatus Auribacterota bacterium]